MANKKLGKGQNRQLKADYGRDRASGASPQERREIARRQGSSKKPGTRKSLKK